MIMLPDGTSHWPIPGYAEYNKIAPVMQFQFIQKTLENIEVKLVVGHPLNAQQEERLKQLMNSKLGYAFDLEFSYHDEIPRSACGKFEDFISLVET